MNRKTHWEQVYREKSPDAVSWYQTRPEPSLSMIRAIGLRPDAPIIDVGGGASTLVDHLLDEDYTDLTVLDLSAAAIGHARQRLGKRAEAVAWIEADITGFQPARRYALWHDRAVLHFLVDPEDRRRYRAALDSATEPGSHIVIGTFSESGPEKCSGLEVVRYNHRTLAGLLGDAYRLRTHQTVVHRTPWEAEQSFLFCHFQREA